VTQKFRIVILYALTLPNINRFSKLFHWQNQMFNVSTLLLDDALKPATPLIAPLVNGVAGLSASSSSKEDTLNI